MTTATTSIARPFGYKSAYAYDMVTLLPDNNLQQDYRLFKSDDVPFLAEIGDETAYQQIPTNVFGELHGIGQMVEDGEVTAELVYENNRIISSRIFLNKNMYLETLFNDHGDMILQQEITKGTQTSQLAMVLAA